MTWFSCWIVLQQGSFVTCFVSVIEIVNSATYFLQFLETTPRYPLFLELPAMAGSVFCAMPNILRFAG
jgi:hypothetical protein